MSPEENRSENTESLSVSVPAAPRKLWANFSYSNIRSVFKERLEEEKESVSSAKPRTASVLWRIISESKSPWYYWYKGNKMVAIQAWAVSFLIMFAFALLATGSFAKAIIYVLIGVALENMLLVLIPIIVVVDYWLPIIPDSLYSILITPILIAALSAFVLNRLAVYIVVHSKDRSAYDTDEE
jgi:hypothetical protein